VIGYALAAVPVAIWLYLLLGHGGFWLIGRQFAPLPVHRAVAATVVAVVPARNEAGVIADAIRSLLQQDFAGAIHVILVDDGSTDGTGTVAAEAAASIGAAARLSVIRGAPLASEWSGKVWAMSQGVNAAAGLAPDYLLFTDADIHHDPTNVAALVTLAEAQHRDLVSYMVRLHVASLAEKLLIPAFVFFFLKLYPPAWIASGAARSAGAAGGCILITPAALERAGGLRTIRSQIIDDCALARAVKGSGGSIWLGLTRSAHSTRPYGSAADIGRMISRTAFNQLQHSYALLAATIIALFFTYLLPPLLLLSGHAPAIALGAAAWVLMAVAYVPLLAFYDLSPLWGLCLPAVALFYAGATVHSALQYRRGRGGQWKGRVQDTKPDAGGGR
jgi:hopene-associated glycosyltransferase HpnB